jgi:steroid 5-alpha reductase family enzyme
MSFMAYLSGLGLMILIAVFTWIISVKKHDVSIVDSIWSLMILAGGAVFYLSSEIWGLRNTMILSLLLIWALRLSLYVTWRNWGEGEDRRYKKIRDKYSPNFAAKSLGIIFIFQAIVAWIISLPLWPALADHGELHIIDFIAILLWCAGMYFESFADWQLARFKANPANRGKVMDRGLWRYTRHPNYFGETLVWWAFYLFALTSGAWWTLPAPLLMTWLLLKFSGVALLEEDITERRPAYREYIKSTNAFLPWKPRHSSFLADGG